MTKAADTTQDGLLTHELSRREFVRYSGAAGALALLPGFLAACGSGNGDISGTLSFVVPQVPRVFDVTDIALPQGATVLPALEPVLIADPKTGAPKANIAEEFEQLDPTTYRFAIRDGVTFWDGSAMTPEDVAFSMELHGDKANGSPLFEFWADTGVQVSGSEITVTLAKPDFNFIYAVTQTGVVQEKFWSDAGDKIGTPGTLNLGTGPLKVVDFVPSQSADFERYEDYWGEKAPMDGLRIETIDDENTKLAATRSGEVTGNFAIIAGRIREYEGLGNVNTTSSPDPSVVTVFFNPNLAPFDDIHVRKAVALSIDKEGLNTSVFGGVGTIADSLVPPFLVESLIPEDEVEDYLAPFATPFDPEQAQAELAQSKVPDGFEYDLITPAYEPETLQVGLALADSLESLGITLNVKEVPAGQFDDTVFFGGSKAPMGLVNYGPSAFTPVNVPLFMLDPANLPPDGYANIAGFKSQEIGRISKQIGRLSLPADASTIADLLHRILEINAEEVVYAPIVFPGAVLALDTAYQYTDFTAAWPLSPWFGQVEAA